ncbi:endoribonuclease MazF [Caldalkalibacillus thermarum TA2.A1]|uniref:Endoribonuclease MazF n=1 Tax=Caldalkalibacillus thermarum (strain TA2.A1) TaxID=986075 RepID=A0A8X8LA97_CALTT|nr:endoribonuclease MazF [Caldalkalibacillus thermarum]QZT33683.1 endoribonuclease MazF [Caldalkalibacillus thermarum TA2.A1]
MVKDYVPKRGDLIWANFDPQMGHEQAGRRPALIISPEKYNRKVGLALMCPVTSKSKGYPFEVDLDLKIKGVILADQIKSFDWRAREAEFICEVPTEIIEEVFAKIQGLIG